MVTKPPAARGPSPRRVEDDGFAHVSGHAQTTRASSDSPDSSDSVAPQDAASSGPSAPPDRPGPRGPLRARVSATLRVIRANPSGRIALKVFVGFAGALVVAIGLALIPLPGPGWALVILGLAIWAIEFVWAKHLLRFTRARVHQWTEWVKRQSWPVRIMLGLVGLVFIATVLLVSLKYSFGIDLVASFWTYVTTH